MIVDYAKRFSVQQPVPDRVWRVGGQAHGRRRPNNIPTINLMQRNRRMAGPLPTIVALDGADDSPGSSSSPPINRITEDLQITRRSHPQIVQRRISQGLVIQVLIDEVCKFRCADEEKRKALSEFLMSCFVPFTVYTDQNSESTMLLRNNFQRTFTSLMQVADSMFQNSSSNISTISNRIPLILQQKIPDLGLDLTNGTISTIYLYNNSKYLENFYPGEKIGKGGNGVVYKAKHKVDGTFYANKFVPIKPKYLNDEEQLKRILQEAQLLSKLTHPNIVAYKTAWLDTCTDPDCFCSPDNSPSSTSIIEVTNDTESEVSNFSNNRSNLNDDSSNSIMFSDDCSNHPVELCVNSVLEPVRSPQVRRKTFGRSLSCTERRENFEESSKLAICRTPIGRQLACRGQGDELRVPNDASQTIPMCHTVLVIQMELCESNLRHWLDERNDRINKDAKVKGVDMLSLVNEEEAMGIFKSVLKGVKYLHSKEMIHRDLKPSNIFFDKENRVKIGDFGLAVFDDHDGSNDAPSIKTRRRKRHTSEVGTKPYAAPEQLSTTDYDSKADMYSIGIILIDLLQPFVTGHEKNNCLEMVKQGVLPDDFQQRWPKQSEVILKLTAYSPTDRPGAEELLTSTLFAAPDGHAKRACSITDRRSSEESESNIQISTDEIILAMATADEEKESDVYKKKYEEAVAENAELRKRLRLMEKVLVENGLPICKFS